MPDLKRSRGQDQQQGVQWVLQDELIGSPADEHRHASRQGQDEKHLILWVTDLVATGLDGAGLGFIPSQHLGQQPIDGGPHESQLGVGEHPDQFAGAVRSGGTNTFESRTTRMVTPGETWSPLRPLPLQ